VTYIFGTQKSEERPNSLKDNCGPGLRTGFRYSVRFQKPLRKVSTPHLPPQLSKYPKPKTNFSPKFPLTAILRPRLALYPVQPVF